MIIFREIINTKVTIGLMIIKLNIEKAYDSIE